MKIYLVGGAIRDALLNLPIEEKDWLVVGGTPQQLLKQGFVPVGKDFPVFLHPKTKEEYALARIERKSEVGHTGFECNISTLVTLEEDLMRRDLTINAIAQDNLGHLIDPYGGLTDLTQRVLRHISPAFEEDPLRVLRVARFAAKLHNLNFTIAADTLALMRKISSSGELQTLSPERIWSETTKALLSDNPQIYFDILKQCGALEVLYPEIAALFGVPAPEKWHPEIDTGIHTLLALQQAAKLTKRLDIRFAVLVHDVGKGKTPRDMWPSHPKHGQRGVTIVREMAQRLRLPKKITQLSLLICEFHDTVHIIDVLSGEKITALLNRFNVFKHPENLEALLLASIADIKGRLGFEHRFYPQAEYLTSCFQIANTIQATQIIEQGFHGPAITQELNRQRAIKIDKFRKQTPMLKEFRVQE